MSTHAARPIKVSGPSRRPFHCVPICFYYPLEILAELHASDNG
jgi:hypothetical protein